MSDPMGHPEKEYDPIFQALKEQGFEVNKTQRGHYEAVSPDKSKPLVFFSVSAERCAIKNTIRDLRRSGFKWDDHEPKHVGETTMKNALQKAGIGRNNGHAEPPPDPPRPIESGPVAIDAETLFKDLKEKKELEQLHEDTHNELLERLSAMAKEVEQSRIELRASRESRIAAKKRFDAFFDAVDEKRIA